MSSLDGKPTSVDDELPPALSSMWRLCKLGYQHEPGLMVAAFVLSLLAALPDALHRHVAQVARRRCARGRPRPGA